MSNEGYGGLNPPIEPGSPDDWTPEQLDRFSAGRHRRPRRALEADGSLKLTREESVRLAAALLFYFRAWKEDPSDPERSAPTRELLMDVGRTASAVVTVEANLFPDEILLEAEEPRKAPGLPE